MNDQGLQAQFGKYRLLEQIGSGAIAEVYRAYDPSLDREVALKLLRPGMVGDAQAFQRFLQEVRGAAKLFHPHIATVLEVGESEGRYYIAMRYIAGKALDKLLEEAGHLTWQETLRLAEQIGAALDYAHGEGFLHGDVKPSNIIRTEKGEYVLTDFGLVKALMASGLTTQAGAILGTPSYIPPEIWLGQEATPQSDQYALACVLYEALTGNVLFSGETPPAVMTRHVLNGAEFEKGWFKDAPAGVETVFLKALAKEPGERYTSLSEFVQALRSLETRSPAPREAFRSDSPLPVGEESGLSDVSPLPVGEGAGVRETSAMGENSGGRRSLQKLLPFAPLVLILLCALLVGAVYLLIRVIPTRTPTETTLSAVPLTTTPTKTTPSAVPLSATPIQTVSPTITLTPSPTPLRLQDLVPIRAENLAAVRQLARLGKGVITQIAYAPQGDRLAVGTSLGVYVYDAQSLEQVNFFETGSWVTSVAFSPDGGLLACGSDDGTVRLWRASDGGLVDVLKGHTRDVWSVAFSPDGGRLASGSGDGTVRLWWVSDGELVGVLEGHTNWVASVAFSPDGARLASGSGDGTVRLWRASDGELLGVLKGHTGVVNSVAFSPDGALLACGSGDGTVRLWRVSDGQLVGVLEGHKYGVTSVAFSPDGGLLASGSDDETVRLWRVSDGELVRVLRGHTDRVTSVAFSADGRLLASGSDDNTVRLWRASDGELLRVLRGHTDRVRSVAFSVDGRLLASGSWDGTVRLWGVSDGGLVRVLAGHTDGVRSVAFSADGRFLASGSWDGTVRLWGVSP
jgi:WD40 repeat protein/tRNA A-37 threonylcarbamoyl transferase component Bud32